MFNLPFRAVDKIESDTVNSRWWKLPKECEDDFKGFPVIDKAHSGGQASGLESFFDIYKAYWRLLRSYTEELEELTKSFIKNDLRKIEIFVNLLSVQRSETPY